MRRFPLVVAAGFAAGWMAAAAAATGLVQLDNAQLSQLVPGSEQASVQLAQDVPPERRLTIVRSFHPSGSFVERRTGTTAALRRTPPERGEAAGAVVTVIDTGAWWIDGNRLCVRYDRWFDRRAYCSTVERNPAIPTRVTVRLGPIDPDTPTTFNVAGPALPAGGPGEHEKGAGGGGGGGGGQR
jgi:hypothetical protein